MALVIALAASQDAPDVDLNEPSMGSGPGTRYFGYGPTAAQFGLPTCSSSTARAA